MNATILTLTTLFVVTIFAHNNPETSYRNAIKDLSIKYYHAEKKQFFASYSEKFNKQCPGLTEKFNQADKIFDECVDKISANLTICETARRFLLKCTQPYIKIANDCLPEDTKGLPDLLVKIVHSGNDYLCKQDGESLLELVNPCVWANLDGPERKSCREKSTMILAKYLEKIPSTKEFCGDIKGLRGCSETLVDKCGSPVTRRVHVGLYEALVSPCS